MSLINLANHLTQIWPFLNNIKFRYENDNCQLQSCIKYNNFPTKYFVMAVKLYNMSDTLTSRKVADNQKVEFPNRRRSEFYKHLKTCHLF